MVARTLKDWVLLSKVSDCNPLSIIMCSKKAWDMDIHKDVPRWTEELAVRRIGKDNAKRKSCLETAD